ncbi:MAG: transporter substrate-binding domain-containing protein [Anaerolineaceae bacterium]|nr:transporter substrate-binding domain-containing protein [Anaerolineaceae bacterium]MDE0609712.1 transporter substrate-binding domain-containing protein [Anaerolineaceae bacterium]
MVAPARRAVLIALGLMALTIVAAFAGRGRTPAPEVADLFPGGNLRIGIETSPSPYVHLRDGEPEGLVIRLGQALAGELDLTPNFINVSLDGRFDTLRLGIVDLLIVVDARQAAMEADILATRPWFNAGLVLVSHEDRPFHSMQDMAGRSLALALGSAADSEARRWQRRIAAFETLPYELPQHALDALRFRVAHAALVDALDARLYLRQHELAVAMRQVSDQHVAMALLSDPPTRWQILDRALGNLFEQGAVARLLGRWL